MRSPFLKSVLFGSMLALSFSTLADQHAGHGVHDVHAAEAQKGSFAATLASLGIEQPWSRALPPTAKTGAVFVGIYNQGEDDRLVAADTPIAEKAELHTHRMQEGLMQMIQVKGIEIPGHGGRLELKPGSYHIMLIGLKQPLREGDRFPLQLTFEKSGTVELDVEVRSLDADTGAEHSRHH